MVAPLFLLIYILPLTVAVGYQMGGGYNFLTPFTVFVVVPVCDLLLGVDKTNPDPAQEQALSERRSFRWITFLAVPVLVALVVWGAWVVTHRRLSGLELVGFTLSVGLVTGAMGINVAHELVHKLNRLESALGYTILSLVCYMHWGLEHVKGHHRWVATPQDPATAKLGQSFYAFLPQTIFGSVASAWRIEKFLAQKKGRTVFGPRNRFIQCMLVQAGMVALFWALFGPRAVVFYFVQGFIAVCLLEVVNYIEHYGLLRRKDEQGRWEKVEPIHSWNASNRLTNYFLFNLQRHSDHHAKPSRRYQILRHFDEAPQLSTGYAGMLLLALVPPLWRRVMDPRVAEHRRRIGFAEAAS